jgi:hypothetical protein
LSVATLPTGFATGLQPSLSRSDHITNDALTAISYVYATGLA